jgi:predicted O-methyltransferase YrrM
MVFAPTISEEQSVSRGKGSKYRYAFDNPAYSWGDGSGLHAMLRHHRPKRIIEIGSGWSSACMVDTVEHYLDGACSLTFVEPNPALVRELIGKFTGQARYFEQPVQHVPLAIFEELETGDIVFIDSTHVLRTGSDVCFELFEILPCLRPGVLVHFHDMFWPFEYPRAWAVDENRSWNELYAVRAFLTDNAHWRIILFNDYLARFERPMLEVTYPQFLRNSGGALWLERT